MFRALCTGSVYWLYAVQPARFHATCAVSCMYRRKLISKNIQNLQHTKDNGDDVDNETYDNDSNCAYPSSKNEKHLLSSRCPSRKMKNTGCFVVSASAFKSNIHALGRTH